MTAIVPDPQMFPRLAEQTNIVVARHAIAIWPAAR